MGQTKQRNGGHVGVPDNPRGIELFSYGNTCSLIT